jgi:hypothetical protein
MKTSIGEPMFSGVQIFLGQFLTRKSVLCRLLVSSALPFIHRLIIRAIRPTDAITPNLPHQFEQLSHVRSASKAEELKVSTTSPLNRPIAECARKLAKNRRWKSPTGKV